MGLDVKYVILDGDLENIEQIKDDSECYWDCGDVYETGVEVLCFDYYRTLNLRLLNDKHSDGILGTVNEQVTKLKLYQINLAELIEEDYLAEANDDLEELINLLETTVTPFKNQLLFRVTF